MLKGRLLIAGSVSLPLAAGAQWGQGPVTLQQTTPFLPCDAVAAAGQTCVAAYSFTRALYANYNGVLFTIQRESDNKTLNISPVSPGGMADYSNVYLFCSGTTCTVQSLTDQTGNRNTLPQAILANQLVLTSSGTGLYFGQNTGGRHLRQRTGTNKIPTGSVPISTWAIYDVPAALAAGGGGMVFGDMEATVADTGNGHMFANMFSTCGNTTAGCNHSGNGGIGPGPFAGVDIENGWTITNFGIAAIPPGGYQQSINHSRYAFTIGKSDGRVSFTNKSGDAQDTVWQDFYVGSLNTLWQPLHLEGGLSLREGGDGTDYQGGFYEGAIIASVTSNATDNVIKANIASFYSRF
jgi:non-reducing end alpha-L-arabinofuranosidase